MKTARFFFLGVILLLLLHGCSSEQRTVPNSSSVPSSGTPISTPEAKPSEPQKSTIPISAFNTTWPKEILPEDTPPYAKGTIANSGGPDDDFVILIEKTTPEDLTAYMEELHELGWIHSEDSEYSQEMVLGNHILQFQWNATDFLQISYRQLPQGEWPTDTVPKELIPPENAALVGEIELIGSDEDGWYFVYTYDGIDESAAEAYMNSFVSKGWEGDPSFVSKGVDWRGKNYDTSIEIYKILETRSSFIVNLYPN
jgi:hypothetical protein